MWQDFKAKAKEEFYDLFVISGMLMLASVFLTCAVMIPIFTFKLVTQAICG